jgi:hypothetical protein
VNATALMKRIADASPRLRTRIAGALYWFSLVMAAFTELFVRGSLNIAGGLLAVLGMATMTVLLYGIFKPASGRLSLLAAFSGLVGLGLEALRWQPQGVNVAIVFSGFYCLLIACLIFRSTFLPRILGALMALGGFGWLTYLSPPLADRLSPYNLALGLLGEGLVMLSFLVIGLDAKKWKELAAARRVSPVSMDP